MRASRHGGLFLLDLRGPCAPEGGGPRGGGGEWGGGYRGAARARKEGSGARVVDGGREQSAARPPTEGLSHNHHGEGFYPRGGLSPPHDNYTRGPPRR